MSISENDTETLQIPFSWFYVYKIYTCVCATLLLRSFSRKNVSLSASSLFRSFFSKFVVEISLCYSFWNLRLWLRWKLRTSNAAVKNRLRYKWTNSGSKLDGHFSIPFWNFYHVEKLWQKISLKEFYKRFTKISTESFGVFQEFFKSLISVQKSAIYYLCISGQWVWTINFTLGNPKDWCTLIKHRIK